MSSVGSSKLPEYTNPPLSEVSVSIQFEPLKQLVVPQIGMLWQHYGEKYKNVEQHPPIESIIERLGVRETRGLFTPDIQFLAGGPPLPRIWFLSDDKRELLQIQQDRFIRNWRKMEDVDIYPRYLDCIRPKFIEDYEDFRKFLKENGVGELKVNQCEMTYVNHINIKDISKGHSELGKVFTIIDQDSSVFSNYEVEDSRLNLRTILRNEEGDFIGRINVSIQSAFSGKDENPIFVLTITARGRPFSQGIDGILKFMDFGRDNIVRIFTDLTTKDLHESWGITEI